MTDKVPYTYILYIHTYILSYIHTYILYIHTYINTFLTVKCVFLLQNVFFSL